MTEKERRIEAREQTDYKAFTQICFYKSRKMPAKSRYDAVTENAVVEIKSRDKYKYDDFNTFTLSLHKLDHLQLGMKKENKPFASVVALYPRSNKVAVFDVTELTPNNCSIEWRYVKVTEYDDEEPVYAWKPFAVLSLEPGKHQYYRTIVLDADLGWVDEDYRKNLAELRKK